MQINICKCADFWLLFVENQKTERFKFLKIFFKNKKEKKGMAKVFAAPFSASKKSHKKIFIVT